MLYPYSKSKKNCKKQKTFGCIDVVSLFISKVAPSLIFKSFASKKQNKNIFIRITTLYAQPHLYRHFLFFCFVNSKQFTYFEGGLSPSLRLIEFQPFYNGMVLWIESCRYTPQSVCSRSLLLIYIIQNVDKVVWSERFIEHVFETEVCITTVILTRQKKLEVRGSERKWSRERRNYIQYYTCIAFIHLSFIILAAQFSLPVCLYILGNKANYIGQNTLQAGTHREIKCISSSLKVGLMIRYSCSVFLEHSTRLFSSIFFPVWSLVSSCSPAGSPSSHDHYHLGSMKPLIFIFPNCCSCCITVQCSPLVFYPLQHS